MKNKDTGYKITIGVLFLVIIFQWIIIAVPKRPKPAKPERIPIALKGRIAIVLDDWGYNLNNVGVIEQIRLPITCSVLPGLRLSREVSKELNARGFEIILHLPMEPLEKYNLEKDTILVSMDEASIKSIISHDLSSIVFAKGVSNHMGSRATGDLRTMGIVFKELKKRGLFFLDSFVSSDSVCTELAKKTNSRFARRDVFLDNQEDAQYIKRQIYELKTKARLRGKAIGIGHDRRLTLEVLKEVMPELEKEGYRFVFLSELVR